MRRMGGNQATFVIFQKARKGHLLQPSIGCNGRSRNLAMGDSLTTLTFAV